MNIRTLSSEELSHRFSECVARRSELEGQYFILDENRKILLEKLALDIQNDQGFAWGKSMALARTSSEFDIHIEGQGAVKHDLYQARGDVAECDFEIKRRLNLSFSQNQQRKADGQMT